MPALTGFASSITLGENLVNGTPQLLDGDVVFTDAEGDFDGGTLTLSGLLAEDRVSVRNEGSGAGQIGLSSNNVTFGGVTIGTLAGGVGGTLTITFNAAATSAAIDALIQNLTYANVSNAPTAGRTLALNVVDAAGGTLAGPASFTEQFGAANTISSVHSGQYSTPTFLDVDGDGDLDAVAGWLGGTLHTFRNTGGVFTELTGVNNPLNGQDVGTYSSPTAVDIDLDGDMDLVVGARDGALHTFRNTAGVFAAVTGVANPFNGIDIGSYSRPAFLDIDGDGDLDLVVGEQFGALRTFTNAAGVFTEAMGGANPFNTQDVGAYSRPAAVDIDGDGDMDLAVGANDGTIRTFINGGGGVFTPATGTANPFNGIDVGFGSVIAFTDVDGDGDWDLILGGLNGGQVVTPRLFLSGEPTAPQITVTVTAEADATSAADTLAGTAGADTIDGLDGDDILSGGAGNDTLDGNTGSDTADYSGAASGVLAQLNDTIAATDGDGGFDTLISIENLTGSAFIDLLVGNGGANVLNGGLGADTLLGLGGNDILIGGTGASNTLQGGLGDDTYVVDANDTVTEFIGEGTDTIQTSRTTYVLKTHFENLQYTGSSAFRGTGNSADNGLEGGSGNDVLIGRGGNDLLDGNSGTDTADYSAAAAGVTANLFDGAASNDGDGGSDTLSEIENLTGSAFADSLTGDAMANLLNGGSGNDVLAGRGGNDVLRGGTGTDTADYSGAAAGVTIKLALNAASNDGDGGSDSFNSIENLTGSAFNDTISGDGLANVINGGLGGDVLIGLGGNDTLIGGAGASNTLQGGQGDDIYVVSANDTIAELGDQGTDTVQTDRAFFTLGANLENLTYTGSGVFQGTGNALANVITGGALNDTLIGGQGNDTLNGGAGTADYVVLQGTAAQYTVTDLGGGSYQIVDAVGGRDGTDTTTGVERVRFASGPTASLASLVVAPGTPPEPVDKSSGEPQTLPGLSDDAFLPLAKDGDLPLVLPGAGDPFADLFGGLQRLSLDQGSDSPWQMLSLDQDGTVDHAFDGLIGARDHSGWNHDAWLF